ncbi:hypothetical protein PRIC1_008684 [Phytophthora ramorum]|uniref:uncharacterized protein n=1 Tax=Phytophthora ramorum TaxID=164328 RepID=UPI00309EB468|nr:hypothetical protein KRP23_6553 [Phytophthora ramorum]KAH7505462.1 hypothetical protein KRP22_5934 [Phytophthora ramorum]
MSTEDLYGDLDTSTSALEKKEALDLKTQVEKENSRLRDELAQLQEQNRQLGAANKQLETNISTLFVTAQLELSRKDKEIQRLRSELEGHKATSRRQEPTPRG